MMRKSAFIFFILAFARTGFAASTEQQMQLELVDQTNNQMDLTFIYFTQGISTSYNYPEDEPKSLDTAQDVPQLYSFTSDSIGCYSNGYGSFSSTTVIALGIRASADSTYNLSIAGIDNFDPSTLILLEDRQLGTFTNLRAGGYTLHTSQAGQINNRFYLHVTFPPMVTTVASGCNNNTGMVYVAQDTSVNWSSCTLVDSAANPINTLHNQSGNFSFGGLPQGSFNVVFVYNNYQSSKPAMVDGNRIKAVINASATHAAVGQIIDFTSVTTNATNYTWQFGDSGEITGIANPSYSYSTAGNYVVMLTASNSYGCMETTTLQVDVSQPSAIAGILSNAISVNNDHTNLRISINDITAGNYYYEMYTISGQLLKAGQVTSPYFEVNLSGYASGVYLVSIKGGASTYTKKIVLPQ